MDKIKTRRSERRLSRYLIEEALRLVAERSECEGVSKETAKRHASAIRGVIPALGVVKSKVIKPGVWVALYARSDSTSTVISNMNLLPLFLSGRDNKIMRIKIFTLLSRMRSVPHWQ
ncbi:Uncharacterised protein [Salmonella enterica subsp. enterica serovar Daytona]|uniref:Uncharacterized protein n=1 Tax=Salmonella enterica subsp. enterica serovar Daytona TaxID=1962639 RepID=A0A447JID4_SALET|nr:Uncharacterised protein [Salmonella enterica subsp. enterica serovar Daytona]